MHTISLDKFKIGPNEPLLLISGPCVIESREHAFSCAETLKEIASHYSLNFVFKASCDKANRSAHDSFRGPGFTQGLEILSEIRQKLGILVTTDVHTPEQAQQAGSVIDIIQIPAFLSRQTDLLLAAAQTGKCINVKKGQFLAPWDMANVIEKIRSANNPNIILTDRGTCFGYNNLVSDMRSIPLMQQLGVPVCFDASHSTQLPGAQGSQSGGQREMIPHLAKAAIAAGANILFIEAHPNPAQAKSDSSIAYSFDDLPALLNQIVAIYDIVNEPTPV